MLLGKNVVLSQNTCLEKIYLLTMMDFLEVQLIPYCISIYFVILPTMFALLVC